MGTTTLRGHDPFLAALRKEQELYPAQMGYLVGFEMAERGQSEGPLPAAIVTGADGRFTIKGIGRERLVYLRMEGPGIVARDVYAMTRPGDTLRVPGYQKYLPRTDILTLYGDGFGHVAAPCKVITGVVRDKDTGKPLPGAIVTSYLRAGSSISGVTDLRAVTDKDGRYRLSGMPKGQGNIIRAAPPKGEPYLLSIRAVADTPGLKPVRVDFALKRGVWLRGRVLDQRTRRPLHACVEYVVFADNPHLREAPGLEVEPRQTNPRDGTYCTVALPGRGLVAARAWNDRYRSRVGAARIKGLRPDGHFNTEPHLLHPSNHHRLVEINPAADAREVPCDLLLDSGTTLKGTVQRPDGKPLAGVRVSGLRTYGGFGGRESNPLQGSDFVVTGLAEGEGRLLLFMHPEKRLAGHLLLKGDEKGPLTVRRATTATLSGRLVTPSGEPVTGGRLVSRWGEGDGNLVTEVRPGKDGKFRVGGLAPGLAYHLGFVRGDYFHQFGGAAAGPLILKAGESKDLGDVVVKPIK